MSTKYDVIIIGAGPNGLVAARSLARRRRKVLVLEAADEVGGHTRPIEFCPGFRAPLNEDAGWVPEQVARIARAADLQKAGGAISMSVVAGGADRQMLHLPSRVQWASERIAVHSARDARRWPEFVERLNRFATLLGELYALVPPDIDELSVGEALPLLGIGRKLRSMGRGDMTEFLRVMPMPVQDLLDDTFESDLLKSAVAAAAVRDLRQGPRSAGTTFNLLHYMVGAGPGSFRGRPWFMASPDAFAQTLLAAAQKKKVEVRTGARVERITAKDGVVTGVVLANGDEISAKTVVSTVDPRRTLLKMVDPVWLDPEFMLSVKNVKMRGCTAYVCYALDRAVDDTVKSFTAAVSLTSTTTALEKAADAAKYGELAEQPHIEIYSPTLRWPNLAPEGKHIVVARIQYAPYALKSGSWDAARGSLLQQKATEAIERQIPGFQSTILDHAIYTPKDVEEEFGVTEGAMTQGELTLDQILFMRPVPGFGRYAMPLQGLYLGGSGAHPGPGLLGGAGYLAARTALKLL